MDALAEANGTFALRLFRHLCQDRPSHNVFCSPVSVSSALAMVFLGAQGHTAAEMAQVLCFDAERHIHGGFRALLAEVNKRGAKYSLRTANTLFGEETFDFLSTFRESCRRFYHAEPEPLSFTQAAEQSRNHINSWVSKTTEGKIQDVLPAGSVGNRTKMVLINATYFKGRWDAPFDSTRTREMPFKTGQNEQTPVQMMNVEATFRLGYIQELGAQVLELPYEDEELSMLILLPDDNVALSSVEEKLTFENFRAWTRPGHVPYKEVDVLLPRFTLEELYDMGSVLQSLGITDAFEPGKADFSAMSAERDLCVSMFVHKASVEVDEDGPEPGEDPEGLRSDSVPEEPRKFCADRPFLFFIRHNRVNCILFCGRFCRP